MATTDITTTALLRDHGFAGRVIEPSEPAYDLARFGWNGAIDRRPLALARPLDTDDVAAVVRACRAAGIDFTVRGGGHSTAGRSLRDGALCIDLCEIDEIDVDSGARIVRAGGGALLAKLDAATQQHGLAVPAGQISHTGIGGLTLGGGIGWLMRRHGLTVDSLLACEAVLADGSIVRASAEQHPDLFWALRGGGGDFAIVTRFEFAAHPVGPELLAGMLLFEWERSGEMLRRVRDLMRDAPDELTVFAVMITAPPVDPFPAHMRGQRALAVAAAWAGDMTDGERFLAPLREAAPALDLLGPMPYVALQTMLDQTAPHGWSYHDRMHYFDKLGDECIDAMRECFEHSPTPESHLIFGWMGGAVRRVDPDATAFAHRDAGALAWLIGCAAEGPVEAVRDWVRGTWLATAGYATGAVYVNALHEDRPLADAYPSATMSRLRDIKRRYDPDGVLRGNGV